MPEVPIPFTDEEVDTGDGATSVGMTIALVIAGFALFAWARGVGGYVANQANSYISNALGFDPTSGENSGPEVL